MTTPNQGKEWTPRSVYFYQNEGSGTCLAGGRKRSRSHDGEKVPSGRLDCWLFVPRTRGTRRFGSVHLFCYGSVYDKESTVVASMANPANCKSLKN